MLQEPDSRKEGRMSDQQIGTEEPTMTLDDEWVNRLATRIGLLTAQNERLIIECEMLRQRLEQTQAVSPNGQQLSLDDQKKES
jgi:regulator of replication initiation timing